MIDLFCNEGHIKSHLFQKYRCICSSLEVILTIKFCSKVNTHMCKRGGQACLVKSTFVDLCYKLSLHYLSVKVKVSPIYDPYVGECLLERTLVLSHRLFEVGWPVPFLAAFISPVFPSGPHSLLGGQ